MNTYLELERQAAAYFEFLDLSQAVQTFHKLDLVIRMPQESSVARGKFAANIISGIVKKRSGDNPAFLGTTIDVSEDNRSIYLESFSKSHVIEVATWLKSEAKNKGFTITQ